jgi:hypothetical protein
MSANLPTPVAATPGPKDENYREIYANVSRVALSAWDLRIVFGQSVEGEKPGTLTIKDMFTVVMSPQHAKVLLDSWVQAIKTYEDNFGVIPDLSKQVAELMAKIR